MLGKGILDKVKGYPNDKAKGLEYMRLGKKQLNAKGFTTYDAEIERYLAKYSK